MKAIRAIATKGERGFTLVELVVVIAILGVLAAISVPMVNNFLDSSKSQAYSLERERIQRAVDAYRSHPLNARFTGHRQYPIHGEAKTRGPFETPDGDTATHRTLVITGNPLGGTKGGQPLWVDDLDGIREPATEEVLNDADDVPQPGWQVATVTRQTTDYIVDTRDYFINFETLILQGLLEAIPPSASPDNQPLGSMRTFVGPYSWYVNSLGIVDSLLFAYPVPANAGYQDVFPSQKQPEGTTPPSIEGNKTVDENSEYTLTLISRDPRVVPDKWDIDWGDGDSDEVPRGNTTATHTYLDGTNFFTISASATDSAGTFVANVLEVQVINLPPTITSVTASNPTVNEGGSTLITVVATDPAGANDPLTYEFDCNNDSLFEKSQPGNTHTCIFGDSGSIRVNVRVKDGDGGSDTDSTTVTVNNVNPAIGSSSHGEANEGSNTTITVIAVDRGFDDGITYEFDCNDDGGYEVGPQTANSAECFFDDNDTFTVNFRLTDDDGVSIDGHIDVDVNNVDPVADVGGPYSGSEGTAVTFDGSASFDISSADNASLTYEWDFGDTTTGTGITVNHIYDDGGPDPGTTYTVTLTVTDKDGGSDSDTIDVTIANVNPVADAGTPPKRWSQSGTSRMCSEAAAKGPERRT